MIPLFDYKPVHSDIPDAIRLYHYISILLFKFPTTILDYIHDTIPFYCSILPLMTFPFILPVST